MTEFAPATDAQRLEMKRLGFDGYGPDTWAGMAIHLAELRAGMTPSKPVPGPHGENMVTASQLIVLRRLGYEGPTYITETVAGATYEYLKGLREAEQT